MTHISEADLGRALDELDALHRDTNNEPGALGIQSRLQNAVLRQAYIGIAREINAGATIYDLRPGIVDLITKLLISLADTASGGDPQKRLAFLAAGSVELGLALRAMMNDATQSDRIPIRTIAHS